MRAFFGQSDVAKTSEGQNSGAPEGTAAEGQNPASSDVIIRSLEIGGSGQPLSQIPESVPRERPGSDELTNLSQNALRSSLVLQIGSSTSLAKVAHGNEVEITDENRKFSDVSDDDGDDDDDDNDDDDTPIDAEVQPQDHSEDPVVIRFTREGRQSFEEDGEYVNECATCQCKTYDVSPSLSVRLNRCHFFSKVMGVKTAQLAVINGWIIFQEVISFRGFRIDVLLGEYHDAVFVAIGLFVLLHIFVRFYLCHTGGRPLPLTIVILVTIVMANIIFVQTLIAAFVCGAEISKYRVRQRIVHELLLTLFFVCGCLMLLPLTNAKNIDVTKAKMFGSAAFATLIFSLLIMFVVGIYEQGKIMVDFKKLPQTWIPVVLTAEFIILVLILEIKLALHGRRCNLSEHDWLFLAMLL